MSLLLTQKSLETQPWLLDHALRVVSQDADFLRASYPGFDSWFAHTVLPGLFSGERTLLIEERDSIAVGLLILKHTTLEKKLCTLRVRPHFESKGVGVRLFQAAFDILKTERPLLSVSETAMPKFERLFSYFGFAQEAVYEGRYLPKVDEFSYNGLLDKQDTSFSLSHSFCQRKDSSSAFSEHRTGTPAIGATCLQVVQRRLPSSGMQSFLYFKPQPRDESKLMMSA